MVKIIDGKKLAQEKREKLEEKVSVLKKKLGRPPKLVSLMIGENKASRLYLSLKEKAAQELGITFEKKIFSSQTEPGEIYRLISNLNRKKKVTGILIQLPLPKKFDPFWLVSKIDPEKDVDCLTPENLGLLLLNKPIFLPAVVKAVSLILESEKIKLKGKKMVIVGAGRFVGQPLAIYFKNLGATVVLCDEETRNLEEWTKKGEILISATGVPGLIKKEMVKKGAFVIDVGSPQPDLDFDAVKKVAALVTPVPGGVGPLTIICLLENLLLAANWS